MVKKKAKNQVFLLVKISRVYYCILCIYIDIQIVVYSAHYLLLYPSTSICFALCMVYTAVGYSRDLHICNFVKVSVREIEKKGTILQLGLLPPFSAHIVHTIYVVYIFPPIKCVLVYMMCPRLIYESVKSIECFHSVVMQFQPRCHRSHAKVWKSHLQVLSTELCDAILKTQMQ